jgi:hypothetical protein
METNQLELAQIFASNLSREIERGVSGLTDSEGNPIEPEGVEDWDVLDELASAGLSLLPEEAVASVRDLQRLLRGQGELADLYADVLTADHGTFFRASLVLRALEAAELLLVRGDGEATAAYYLELMERSLDEGHE